MNGDEGKKGRRVARRAAVVGSGFGGLAMAIRLQSAGVDTVLYEARDKPGGRAYVWHDEGFVFDAGPTVITAPGCLEELWALSGRDMHDDVELIPVEPFYRILWTDGDRFDYGADTDDVVAQIAARHPPDGDGYRRFLEYAKQVFDKGYTELVAHPFVSFRDMIKVAPDLLRLRADRSVYAAVSRFIEDERVRQVMTFNSLLIGGSPFESSAIYSLIHYIEHEWGVLFPRGGTHALVRAMVRLFETLGGEVRLADKVEKLEALGAPATHWVTAEASGREAYDLVVSNTDLHHLYSDLLADDRRARPKRFRLERMTRWSMSLFLVYFGTDRRYEDVAHHSILFGDRYKELIDEIFHGSKVPDDFSLYLHRPTATDPAMAPEGCDAFYALSPVPHLGHAPADWATLGPRYADRVLAYLEGWLPDLRRHVVTQRIFTPADFESELGAYMGNAFSVAPTLSQSAWMRPHNRDGRIDGLYIVGAGTHPGAGVPGVVNSAKATMKVIARDFRLP